MRWNLLGTIQLTDSWQFFPAPTGAYFRINHRNLPANPNAWICQAERLPDGSWQIFDQQPLRPQGGILREIFKLDKAEVFKSRHIGIRQKFVGISGWILTLEMADLEAPDELAGQTLFTFQVPQRFNLADGTSYELGMKFTAKKAGHIQGIRYWKDELETGEHIGKVWSAQQQVLKAVVFANETNLGWQSQNFPSLLPIHPNITYTISVNCNTHYVSTVAGLKDPVLHEDLASIADNNNGLFGSDNQYPTNSFQNSNYFRDIIFLR